jgi:cardiolipin synthase A/B
MIPVLSLATWLSLHGLITVLALLLYTITSHVMRQRRNPSAAIAWILFILLVPYVAMPAFLVFGSRKLQRPARLARVSPVALPGPPAWAVQTIVALDQPPPVAYHALALHADGAAARQALFETLDGARHTIDLATFILAGDDFGLAVLDRLCEKAQAGVHVRLMVDGLGNLMGRRAPVRRLIAAGGERVLFVPPFRSPLKGRTNLRNHRKLLVADAGTDAARLWCGGRNLAQEYFEGAPKLPPWRDLSFDLRGPLVAQAAALFDSDWAFARRATRPPAPPLVPPEGITLDGAQLIASGPDQRDDTLFALLVTAAYRAADRILLATPYFVPDPTLLTALAMAARRGVQVDLLLPSHSNHRLSDIARHRGLRTLAQAGARVWLAPGMFHGKLVVIDDTLALAGSANLDARSLFLNYELMVAFHAVADVQRFAAWFEHERSVARPHLPTAPGLVRDIAEGTLLWVGFQL